MSKNGMFVRVHEFLENSLIEMHKSTLNGVANPGSLSFYIFK